MSIILLFFSIKIRAMSILIREKTPHWSSLAIVSRVSIRLANRLKTQSHCRHHNPDYMRTTTLLRADTYYSTDYKLPNIPARVTMGPKLFVWGSSIMFDPWLHERVCLALMSQGSQLTSSPSSCKFNFKGLTRKFFHSRKIEIEARRSADREIAPGWGDRKSARTLRGYTLVIFPPKIISWRKKYGGF